jgi:polar amino acid transport system substrate-binding protein
MLVNSKAQAEFIILGDPWPPWTSESYGLADGGIAVDFAYRLFENAGLTVQIHLHPWKRVIRMVQYGQADGILMIQPSKKLSEFIYFTEPVFSGKEVICFNKINTPDFKWNSFEDLKKFTIGTILGYNYGNFTPAKENLSLKTVESQNLLSNLKKLFMGRIDLVICDFAALNTILKNNPELKNTLSIAKKPVYEWEYSIGISKFSELFNKKEELNKLIIKMKEQR